MNNVSHKNEYNDDEEYELLMFLQGGSFLDDFERCSPDFSYAFVPSLKLSSFGFRIVRNCD